jgi:hypothetical protein
VVRRPRLVVVVVRVRGRGKVVRPALVVVVRRVVVLVDR